MEFEVVHQVRGRVRLRIPEIKNWEGLRSWAEGPMAGELGIQSFRVNPWISTVVIYYDSDQQGVLDGLLTTLAFFPLSAIPEATEAPPAQSLAEAAKQVWEGISQIIYTPNNFAISSVALIGSVLSPGLAPLVLPLVCISSLSSVKRAWEVLREEKRLNVDSLDTVAIVVSVGRGQIFTAAFITWMISLGDWIRDKTAGKSRRVLKELLEFQASKAWVLRNRKVIRVAASSVRAGETVIVYPGELIPVDGVVVRGAATVDQKTVTGESLPVERTSGQDVFASTVLREGKLRVRATRVGSETTAAQIVHLIESAPIGETRIQNYAERFGDRLVAPALLLSGGLYAATRNLDRLLSMLIIDYGTGIRVAAPTAVLAAMTQAARQGILIKSGAHMEKLASVDTLVFDKTGTLTHGSPEVKGVISFDERFFPERKILALAAAAEARLKHPVSRALVAKAEAEGIEIPERNDSHFEIGLGVEARINGYYVHIGNERFFSKNNISIGTALRNSSEAASKGWSTLLFAVDGVLKGLIPYADRVRRESRQVVQTLQNLGIKDIAMITGDNERTARAVSGQLGISSCFAETLPAYKAELVRDLQKKGRVVGMVGDGINDSPALAHADIGIAMKHGADVARETADVVLMEDSLWKLVAAVELSRNAMRTVRQNYAIIASLNTLALLLAIPQGLISPNTSALISNGSAILASLNAIRPVLGSAE